MAVVVVLAVGLVVALGVAHGVAQREAVVAGDVVDRGPGPAAAVLEEVGRAREPRGEVRALAFVAAPEAAHAVAEAVVPFGEARRVLAELVAARAEIPRLGDQLDPRQHRILAHGVEEAGAGIEAVALAAEGGAEVEAEAVDMERRHPVAQRIHHHLQHARMGQVHRVAGAGVVDVVARIVGHAAGSSWHCRGRGTTASGRARCPRRCGCRRRRG